jgi:hypothetical protein
MKQIHDYLRTQALKLNADEIAVARAATQAVLTQGKAHIDDELVCHDALNALLFDKLAELKQLFIALDSVYVRSIVQTAALYVLLPESGELVRVAQIGQPIENHLPVNEQGAWQYLAVRSAHTGWANIAEDVAHWLEIRELVGEHNRRAMYQISLPIHDENGIVYGVLHVENAAMLPENTLAQWLGFALGVLPMLRELCPRITQENT